ncbi:HIT domain-containing protein [Bacillus thuringiensis]
MDNCIICSKHHMKKNIVFEAKHTIVSLGALESQILGYLYLEPKRHIEFWDELTEEEFLELGVILRKISLFLKRELKTERVYTVTISEAVRHLHIHVIPRECDSDVRGIPLIEQATQQKVIQDRHISEKEIEVFIKNIHSFLNQGVLMPS